MTDRRPADSVDPVGLVLVLVAASIVQFGAAQAARLFPRVGVQGVLSLRLVLAAVILMSVARPRLARYTREQTLVAATFGAVLFALNSLFYQAIARIPLGPTVTLEVLGPLALSVARVRRTSSWLWAGLALVGVALLGRGGASHLNVVGVVLALVAGACWAAYILLSARTGALFPRADGLALALVVGAALSLPLGVASGGRTLLAPDVLAGGVAVAALSSVLPYTLELFALRRIPAPVFAIMTSLGPVMAALVGYLVLGQRLNLTEDVAILLVVTATGAAVRTTTR